jgi:apolipoprotein N-acyltransferase
MAIFVISLIAALAAGWLAYRLAEHKGRSPRAWMAASVLLVVPLLLLVLLPARCPPGALSGSGPCA